MTPVMKAKMLIEVMCFQELLQAAAGKGIVIKVEDIFIVLVTMMRW